MTRIFDSQGYPVDPQPTSSDHFWYYVQKEGVIVATANGSATISWAKIKRTLSDHENAIGRRGGIKQSRG